MADSKVVAAAIRMIDRHHGTRIPRWMDLGGDFAGEELFVLDGKQHQ